MICTSHDGYYYNLINRELMVSWAITLQDGVVVYGDYDRPGFANPWERLSRHCLQNKVYPTQVKLHMFGADNHIFFEDENGLDGLTVMRGIAKDQAMDGSHSQSFQTLTVTLLREDCSALDVSKFVWPHNDFEKRESQRVLTYDNLTNALFKHDSKKLKNKQIQKYLNG